MSVEASVLLDPLRGLLQWFQRNRIHKSERKDAALEAIYKALFASLRYVDEQRESNQPDRQREFELAELWADAAVKVGHASQQLSLRLHDKSIYWASSIKWSREEVLLKRIDFEAVQHELKALLEGA